MTMRIAYLPIRMRITYPYTDNLSAYAGALTIGRNIDLAPRFPAPRGRTPSGARTPPGAHPTRRAPHTRRAQQAARTPHVTRAYKTRPDQPVRARNVFGSGVRTLAVVRAVLTTIATLTTPLRHVILLGFVV